MPNCLPPIEHRFSSTNQPSNAGRKKGSISLVSTLKRYLKKKIKYEDPESGKIIHGTVEDAIVWRLILNATQGDNIALKEIFERIDGKLKETIIDQSKHHHYSVVNFNSNGKPKDNTGSRVSGIDTPLAERSPTDL